MSMEVNSSDEESIPEHDLLLSVFNGYCKINLEVSQTSLFYTKDSLLPINAQATDICEFENNTVDNIADIFNNITISENAEESDDDQLLNPSKIISADEFHCNSLEENDDNKCSLSPKSKQNKNESNKYTTVDNQSLTHTDLNVSASINFNDQYENDKLEDDLLHGLQDQEHKRKPITQNLDTVVSLTSQINENELNSQCPICFGTFPTLDIEMHASRCNPL
ncbi:Hypothetical protein CINCED_3A013427 [Cinara cedri]|uniref:Uncharacterized protein n=1 Tax=Cinara cedri TaxID=506608 RepID=A0A5E4MVS4_9HEMI|nr:Hypothetical protein CINCED_3A013427 [Cinara cedri]